MMRSTICRSGLRVWKKPAILLVWLFLWQAASVGLGHELLLVSPLRTLQTLAQLVWEHDFWYSIAVSLSRFMASFVLALLVGAVLAFLGWRFGLVHDFLRPVLSIMKAAPVVSFIILALLWVGNRYLSTLCAFVMVMPLVYANLYQGLCNVEIQLLEVGRIFGLSKRRLVTQIYIPSLKPYVLSACTVGIGFCWKSGVAAEVIGLPNHTIGMHLYNAKVYLETPELFAWTLVIVVLSVSLEYLTLRVLRRVLR